MKIIDIHTHQSEEVSAGKAIINYSLRMDSPLAVQMESTLPVQINAALSTQIDLTPSVSPAKDGFVYSAGIHPWHLTESNVAQQLETLRQLLNNKQFVALGEVGLDKLTAASMSFQKQIFEFQLVLAEEMNLPLIIHCVKAMDELLEFKKHFCQAQPWVWHGFRGKPEQAKQLLQKGFYLSFGEHFQEEALRMIPDEHLFLETDCSLLSIEDILHRAAKVRGVEVEALRGTIRKNVQNVFFKS